MRKIVSRAVTACATAKFDNRMAQAYLLTGNPAYLQPYTDAKGRIEMDFVDLRAGLSNRTQRERSLESQLESLAGSKQTDGLT
jgi:CHASE3 domain sensor protein